MKHAILSSPMIIVKYATFILNLHHDQIVDDMKKKVFVDQVMLTRSSPRYTMNRDHSLAEASASMKACINITSL
jgi:hypothetical protein